MEMRLEFYIVTSFLAGVPACTRGEVYKSFIHTWQG